MISTEEGRNGKQWLRGDWMQTYTGRKFYPLDPRPEDIDLADIAHALSMICRFGGHVRRFYSVAEHSYLQASHLAEMHPGHLALARWALMHDAAEAYVGDMVRPLKVSQPAYRDVEDKILAIIATRFGLTLPADSPDIMPGEVKMTDNRILLTERDALMSPSGHTWGQDSLEPLPVRIRAWAPLDAEHAFLALAAKLGIA